MVILKFFLLRKTSDTFYSCPFDVEHYVVAELFELVYHRNFAFLCKYLSFLIYIY